MGRLTREQLLGAADLQEETVRVPEWGGDVLVRGLSLAAYQEVQQAATVKGEVDGDRLTVHLLMAGIVDPRLTPDDFEQLRGKSMSPLNRIAGVVMRLSGLGVGALEAAEATFPAEPGGSILVPARPGPGDDGQGAG